MVPRNSPKTNEPQRNRLVDDVFPFNGVNERRRLLAVDISKRFALMDLRCFRFMLLIIRFVLFEVSSRGCDAKGFSDKPSSFPTSALAGREDSPGLMGSLVYHMGVLTVII